MPRLHPQCRICAPIRRRSGPKPPSAGQNQAASGKDRPHQGCSTSRAQVSLYLAALYADGGADPALARDGRSGPRHIGRPVRRPASLAYDPGHPIAYKTGTSHGFRDAWAAGLTPGYTIVVWAGRPDNMPRPGAAGRDTAAPLLFRLFALPPPEPPVHDQPEIAVAAILAPALRRSASPPMLRIMFPPGDVNIAFDR